MLLYLRHQFLWIQLVLYSALTLDQVREDHCAPTQNLESAFCDHGDLSGGVY